MSSLRIRATLFALLTMACGSDAGPTQSDPTPDGLPTPRVLSVTDQGNAGDGSDLWIRFGWVGDAGGVEEWEVSIHSDGSDPGDPGQAPRNTVAATGSAPVEITAAGFVTTDGSELRDGSTVRVRVRGRVGNAYSPWSPPSSAVALARVSYVRTLAVLPAGTGGMETDPAGRIYVADFGTALSGGTPGRTVYRLEPNGDTATFATGLQGASGNAFASDGDLLQSNISAGTISRITPEGDVTTFASGLAAPVGIAVAPGDTLFVAACGDNTVRRVLPDGTVEPFAASTLFSCPNGIALGADGALYVANFGNGFVVRVSPAGDVSTLATFQTNNLGHVTAADGVLYVAVRGLHQIARITLAGDVTVLAGSGVRGGDDGAASSATLSRPNDIAVSPDGRTLYFNDVAPDVVDPNVLRPSVVRALELVPDVEGARGG